MRIHSPDNKQCNKLLKNQQQQTGLTISEEYGQAMAFARSIRRLVPILAAASCWRCSRPVLSVPERGPVTGADSLIVLPNTRSTRNDPASHSLPAVPVNLARGNTSTNSNRWINWKRSTLSIYLIPKYTSWAKRRRSGATNHKPLITWYGIHSSPTQIYV